MAKASTLPVRTPAQLRAAARALDGRSSRVPAAAAVVEPDAEAPDSGGTTGELWLYGVVGGWWFGFDAESVSRALREMDVDHLTVRIHSPGGDAADGVAIGNLLRNHRAKVTCVVDGLAASAASVIAIAGDEVVMCPGSQMMLHDASTLGWGMAADLRRAAEWIDGQSDNYASVYAYRAGGTSAAWRKVMLANDGHGTWYTAADAVAAGLGDEVGNRVAVGSPPVAPDDQLDDEDMQARAMHDLQLLEQCVAADVRAVWCGERRAPKPPSASAVGSTHSTERSGDVAFTDSQLNTMRQDLGLPETADEATIVAALTEALAEQTETPAVATGVPSGHVVIPQARLADLEANAAAGRQAATTLHERDRKALLDANAAKYVPANRAAWEKEYDRDPEATRAHFAAAPDIIPATELGHEVDAETTDQGESLASILESDILKNWSMS